MAFLRGKGGRHKGRKDGRIRGILSFHRERKQGTERAGDLPKATFEWNCR